MNLTHIHLLLNHWPIIGSFIGLGLFLVAMMANSDELKQASLALFAFLALLAIPTYMSGDVANEVFKNSPSPLPAPIVKTHQGAAMIALIFLELTGAASVIGLWGFSRMSRPTAKPVARWSSTLVLILAVATVGLMAIAGNTGGAIRHPEIASGEETASTIGGMGARLVPALTYFVAGYSRWVWPILETLHFVGLILIVAAIGALNVRLLGFAREIPIAPLHRLLPWGIAGFVINIITGMMFFVGMPFFYAYNIVMYYKMVAMVLAGGTLLFFYCTGAFKTWAELGPGEEAPTFAKVIAASSLVLWIAVIVLGRYIPLTEGSLKAIAGN
jgi:hypothetical protein